ncbi:anti-sigma factor [Aeromicrobium sp.]|uniref:anti-sigma factor n=1 Tax=Aeromicrobium sp. TaxID=1871063 RepID=UPI0030C555A5
MTTTDLHSLIAPFALDALDPDERSRFAAHLDQCVTCQAELAGFQATASRLGDAETLTPPDGLRDRLLSEISQTKQERPVIALAQRSALRRTLPRLAMAAAFLVGTVGVGGYAVEHQNAGAEQDRNAAITRVLSSADAETVAKSIPTGGNVRMVMSASKDSAVIFANDLPSPGDGKVYQVWMIDDSGPTDQGTFVEDGDMVMDGITKADRIAVTVEPEGGSERPTTPPVATIPV